MPSVAFVSGAVYCAENGLVLRIEAVGIYHLICFDGANGEYHKFNLEGHQDCRKAACVHGDLIGAVNPQLSGWWNA